ncbi:DUF3806 domain-containing protein [Cellulophaga sp. HaHaR_3_176]|uniref:DUF3806 domain-containing protein n=1 Tax=Cellulophaga sp. HaHaR_3_176 TaxID=1942464 RepID=UPI001C1FB59E|nr:DUF3806 domain-containing protein [Cellulophaga sp. HaHaR_3_176]QWX84822.1 DUF3806 domain-containing protein [Cellulophaga sp. HaHaR_3_176]
MQSTLRNLTTLEFDVLERHLDLGYSICKKYVSDFDGTFTAKLLTEVFGLWLADTTAYIADNDIENFNSVSLEKPNAKMIEFALGSAYGEVLNTAFDTQWKHIADEYGEEICIRHENPEYTTFPYSIVQKRIGSQETVFFEPIMATMKYAISKK